jgi:L-histidine N-alpha-methyltransferase
MARMASYATASADERFSLVRPQQQRDDFAEDVRRGLSGSPKTLPPKYFYDDLGSALFEAICHLPEYYVSRSETEILSSADDDIVQSFGAPIRLIELGSGNSQKTRLLLDPLISRQPALEYVPIDVDGELLGRTARTLLDLYPTLIVHGVASDFRRVDQLLAPIVAADPVPRNVVLFLGSTIGNLDPSDRDDLLSAIRRLMRGGDALLLGADRRKDKSIVEPAYDDALGVTAAFNLNMLVRINAQLGGRFDLANFRHRAFFNETESRIEMHIVSTIAQRIRIATLDTEIAFESGETIHTENSYKFDDDAIQSLAGRTGFAVTRRWTDSRRLFADLLLVATDTALP